MGVMVASMVGERVQPASTIPALTHAEAGQLARQEVERLLALLDTLDGDDWAQPTYCTEWTVRDMAAHLAGSCAGFASWGEFKRQTIQNPYAKDAEVQVDGVNKCQIADRAHLSPAEVIEELRVTAPKAIRTRQRLPWLLRAVRVPFGPPLGFAPIGYLTDTIYTRDEWMHRFDICAATGKPMIMTPEHDGRILALVVADLNGRLDTSVTRPVDLNLRGEAVGWYRLGGAGEPGCAIHMDVGDFALKTSERIDAEEALARVTVEGDHALARRFVAQMVVPF